jgi:hypothetical protein
VTSHATRVLAGALLLTLTTPLAAGEPIAIRDQNPLIRGLYLPVPGDDPLVDGVLAQRFVLTLSNTTNIESRDGEAIRVDGESLELRWLLAWQPVERVRIRVSVPVVHYGGGALDDVVDEWHELLGLPAGSRPVVPGDQLYYYYGSTVGTVQRTDSRTSLGDSSMEAGFRLRHSERSRVSAWVGVEAPTGESTELSGNNAWDVGLWLEGGVSLTPRASLDGRAGMVRPGSAAPLPLEPKDWVAFGSLGATWNATPTVGMRLQLDAHDSMFEDTSLRFLGEALLLTLGAEYRSANDWRWQLALAEDLRVDASPDFAIQLSVQIGGRGKR